jgi:hypothetical protein
MNELLESKFCCFGGSQEEHICFCARPAFPIKKRVETPQIIIFTIHNKSVSVSFQVLERSERPTEAQLTWQK